MKTASNQNELATLSSVLLANLDEVVFFSKITEHIAQIFADHKVLGFEVLNDGSTSLIAENGKALSVAQPLNKGQGLSGYVARTKRAYYSNSVKRDPLASTGIRGEAVESELSIPVMFQASVIGTINVQSTDVSRQFSEADIAIINNILVDLAAPIKNMHLFLMTKNLNRELLGRIEAKEKELSNRAEIKTVSHFEDKSQMVGVSKNYLNVVQAAKKISTQDFPILLEGAHGTGKKILAKKIHAWSNRKGGCVVANCSVLNESQLDRELFSSKGLMMQANGGTIILDDISAISSLIQTKLFRAITSGEMTTVDTDEKVALNVRIIATAKASLRSSVEAGMFKEDLYYRLSTITLEVPALRERAEDIKVMAEFFLNNGKSAAKILTSQAMEKLNDYFWPGNAHELKNVMERTYILSEGQYIEASDLPDFPREEKQEEEVVAVEFSESTLHDLERKHIIDTLGYLNGNKTRAAKALGITVKTLYNKLHSYGLIEAREV